MLRQPRADGLENSPFPSRKENRHPMWSHVVSPVPKKDPAQLHSITLPGDCSSAGQEGSHLIVQLVIQPFACVWETRSVGHETDPQIRAP